jgi:hypothetical protein
MTRSVVIVKGTYRGSDPTFTCLTHSPKEGQYGIIEFEGDALVRRTIVPASCRSQVEAYTVGNKFRGDVYVDDRSDSKLLPLKVGDHCINIDVKQYRRAKSDQEADALLALSNETLRSLQLVDSKKAFRGTVTGKDLPQRNLKTAFERTEYRGFIQYRAGLQDEDGLVSDHTRIVPKTPEWTARLERAYRGLHDVASQVRPGATVSELNDVFMQHMKPEDVVYGDVVYHTGYEGHEVLPLETVQPYDFLTVGTAVSDGTETALLSVSCHSIQEPPPPRPPPLPPPPPPSLPEHATLAPSYSSSGPRDHAEQFRRSEQHQSGRDQYHHHQAGSVPTVPYRSTSESRNELFDATNSSPTSAAPSNALNRNFLQLAY